MSLEVLQTREEITATMVTAMQNQDTDSFMQAMKDYASVIERDVLSQARTEQTQMQDTQILASRGVRQLTSEERKFYQAWIDAAKSPNPKQALENPMIVMPETIIDNVMENLQTNHPLLSHIHFENTGAMARFLLNTNETLKATWGTLFGAITEEAEAGFKQIDMQFLKLSAWMPVSNAMLDLGPQYIDRFVRATLYEMLANGFEYGILKNLKTDTGPIAMIADMSSGSAAGSVITYTEKEKKKITNLNAVTLGNLLAGFTKDENGKARVLREVIMVVNPTDYFKRIFPATTILTPNGTYANNVLPYPITVIQSAFLDEGEAVLGLGYNYFFGSGMSDKSGKIDPDDSVKFLDDARAYRIKLYGNGMPLDNTSFEHLDISELEPAVLEVEVKNTAGEQA